MRLVPVYYFGFTAMDRRFSRPMLPWIVSEIRKRDSYEKLSLGVEDGNIQAYNTDFEIQFSHKLGQLSRFTQIDVDPCIFFYLRDDAEQLLYCYLFQATKTSDVTDLYQQMKEQSDVQPKATRSLSSAANLTSLCVDISPSSSNFYEVLYIGKITAWNKKVPDTFIDDALEKFKAHDLEKNRKKLARLRSESNLRRGSNDSTTSDSKSVQNSAIPNLQRSRSMFLNLSSKSPVVDRKVLQSIRNLSEESADGEEPPISEPCREENKAEEDLDNNLNIQSKSSSDIDDHNRTMVLQIDRTDLRLISPDRKIILLHKTNNEVTTCLQGIAKPEHFGFICNTCTGYVFKCESASVAGEAVGAIRQAFNNADSRPQRAVPTTCEHCPMIWFHKLCCEVENLNDKLTQNAIIKRVKQLDEEEQTVILTKFHGVETDSLRDQNEFLMMLLRAHCEMKQGRHVHDTAENRSEFLNQYLGGNAIFMKAKKSLASSFDNLLKRKASSSDLGPTIKEMSLPLQPVLREASPSTTNDASDSEGSRSSVTGSQTDLGESNSKTTSPEKPGAKSPMMDIFMKVGSPKSASSDEGSPKQDVGSWRQAIFKRVVTPNKQTTSKKRSKEELRALWKKSIHEAILLIRMEKENARLKARQEESAVKRIKLEYDEMKSSERGVMEVWDLVTNKEARIKCDHQMLLNAIRQGVPRGKRGEVWSFLADQFCTKMPPIDTTKFPYYNVTYEQILKQLTSHQHAILIDLGRTFPSHTYYSSPLGPGQLALFNLLKAYSLLDPDVGYCQGLCFVAGVLLLHMDESQAFFLLRHLMFRRGLRKQYLPDMIGLQIQLYQLSRLLHDQIPELYEHFDVYEVAPTLYAAPWLLTIFASQFPLGFVARVFDLMFFESTDVVFRVALALLTHHKDNLLECDSLEEIMNYLKSALPAMDKQMMEKIMKQVYTTDISRQLNEYQVEYHVLQEEMQSVQPQVEAFHKLQVTNKALTEQNKALSAQLEMALSNVQRLEKTRTVQQSSINRLEMQNRGLEVTVGILASFISNLIDDKTNIEIPGEVRRIMSQVSQSERRKNEPKNSNNFMNMFKKSENVVPNPNRTMVKSMSTGRIRIPNIDENQMLRTNSLSTKNAGFFSNSYNHIMQQKLQTQNLLNSRIGEKLVDCSEKEEMKELVLDKNSPDSGVSTPGTTPDSPKGKSADPLSNCDVTCTYNIRELKKVGSLRNITRNSSPDIIEK